MWISSLAGPTEPAKVERVALVGPLADWEERTVGGFASVVLLLVRFPFAITEGQRGGCHLVFHGSSWTSHAMPSLPSLFLCHDIAYLSCNVAYHLTSHHLPSLVASLTSAFSIILSSLTASLTSSLSIIFPSLFLYHTHLHILTI